MFAEGKVKLACMYNVIIYNYDDDLKVLLPMNIANKLILHYKIKVQLLW